MQDEIKKKKSETQNTTVPGKPVQNEKPLAIVLDWQSQHLLCALVPRYQIPNATLLQMQCP